ncbi:putative RNA recognition motif domain, nucleotide-binding alpha-beta plait domain superfamily [Helianthus anomalus]
MKESHGLVLKVKGQVQVRVSVSRLPSFFVSNIPRGCRPWDLVDAFRSHGEVVGALIVKKKDKEGRTFGFVSFKGVKEYVGLEGRMGKMKLGDNRLVVNIARFAKENEGIMQARSGFSKGKGGPVSANGVKSDGPARHPTKVSRVVNNGRSFVDILMNKSIPYQDEDVVDVDPSLFALSNKFGRSLVGRTLDFSVLRSLNVSLRETGHQDIVIQYLGGLTVLLSFGGEMEAKRFAADSGAWAQWFVSIDPWVGQSLFRRVVHESKFQEDDWDLTFDCLGVLTDSGNLISGLLKLKWQDKS